MEPDTKSDNVGTESFPTGVAVGVCDGTCPDVPVVGEATAVALGVGSFGDVTTGVGLGVGVNVCDGIPVAVGLAVPIGDGLAPCVGVPDGVRDGVGVALAV